MSYNSGSVCSDLKGELHIIEASFNCLVGVHIHIVLFSLFS